MEECEARRKASGGQFCCSQVTLDGASIEHCSSFIYLGSKFVEGGGVSADMHAKISKGRALLARYHHIWTSPLKMRLKIRFLKSHVFPAVDYGIECGNNIKSDMALYSVFMNTCRRRLVNIRQVGPLRVRVDRLEKMCTLGTPLARIAPRRVAFIARVMVKPACELARKMMFARVEPGQGEVVEGAVNDRRAFLGVANLDVKFLYSGEADPADRTLDYVMGLAMGMRGTPGVKSILRMLQPDEVVAADLTLLQARPRVFSCPELNCFKTLAEQKELTRHLRTAHPPGHDDLPTVRREFACDACHLSYEDWLAPTAQAERPC